MTRKQRRAALMFAIVVTVIACISWYYYVLRSSAFNLEDILAFVVEVFIGFGVWVIVIHEIDRRDLNDRTAPCPKCKQKVVVTAAYCRHCGSQIEPAADALPEPRKLGNDFPDEGMVLCPRCHEEIDADASICHHCHYEREVLAPN